MSKIVYRQNDDGSWVAATPITYQGWKARLAHRLRKRDHYVLAALLVMWDERKLGR